MRKTDEGVFLLGISASDYHDDAATLIHEFKVEAQTSLAKFMAEKIAAASAREKIFDLENAVLIPAPSREISNRIRGFNPAHGLATAIAIELLKSQKIAVTVISALQVRSAVSDQAALDSAGRRQNLVGAMTTKKSFRANLLAGRQVILVDDIVTTGSTLIEATRALAEAGVPVDGFMTFAETIQRNTLKVPRSGDLRRMFHSQAKLPEDGGHHGSQHHR